MKTEIMPNDDPYGDIKIYHRAILVNKKGQASALCYSRPHPIPNRERWTSRNEAVTCKKCLAILKANGGKVK